MSLISTNNASLYSRIYKSVALKILEYVAFHYRTALQSVPLERPGTRGRCVRNPVCEYVEAKWLGVSRLVPQFSDGLVFGQSRPRLKKLSEGDLLPGDVLICCPDGRDVQGAGLVLDKVSEKVRIFTRGVFTHAAIVGLDNRIYEAALPAIQVSSFRNWLTAFNYVIVLRHDIASEELSRNNIIEYLESQIGARYNVSRAIGIMIVGQIYRKNWQSVIFNSAISVLERSFYRDCHVCSTFVWSARAKGGIASSDSQPGRYVTPSAFVDQVLLEPIGYATTKNSLIPHRLDPFASSYEQE